MSLDAASASAATCLSIAPLIDSLLVSVVDAMDVVDLSVPFQSERDAEIAFEALRVDAEPKRGGVEKKVSIEGNILKVHFR